MEMTFAPGWTQEISASNEKQDLLTYINDTHKAVWGYRPRWDADWVANVTIAALRAEEAHRQAEMAAHHMAVAMAMKPVSPTFKPFTNLKEMLV